MGPKELKEYSQETYENVRYWIENCDTKASSLLAFVGVFLSIVFTSDYILRGIESCTNAVAMTCKAPDHAFSLFAFLAIGSKVYSIFFFVLSIKELLSVLYARLTQDEEQQTPSLFFYRTIGNMTYEDYSNSTKSSDMDAMNEDRLHQIHECSQICTLKFEKYNEGLHSFKSAMIAFGLFVVLLITGNAS